MNPVAIFLLIIKFWDIIKEIVQMVEKLSPPEREKLKSRVAIANILADETGDTSGLEDLINGRH